MEEEFLELYLLFELEDVDDEEEDDLFLLASEIKRRRKTSDLYNKRSLEGFYNVTVNKHLVLDAGKFKKYFRLIPNLFQELLNDIKADIIKQPYNRVPEPLSPEIKLSLTLRYLATGESHRSLGLQYRVSDSYVLIIVNDVFESIIKRKFHEVLKEPTEELWKVNAMDFYKQWNFPMCIGAIDRTHVRITCPQNSGSLYHNYKDYFSMVLLAIVDANYKFIAVDIGSYGREGDAGIFRKSNMSQRISSHSFNIPPPTTFPGTNIEVPHMLLGDSAFALTSYMLKPYSRQSALNEPTNKVFNYRLSRARKVVENAFGIMAQYFRIFLTPINMHPDKIKKAVLVSVILHNILRINKIATEPLTNEEMQATTGNPCFVPIAHGRGRADNDAKEIRDKYRDYFMNQGAVSWQ